MGEAHRLAGSTDQFKQLDLAAVTLLEHTPRHVVWEVDVEQRVLHAMRMSVRFRLRCNECVGENPEHNVVLRLNGYGSAILCVQWNVAV